MKVVFVRLYVGQHIKVIHADATKFTKGTGRRSDFKDSGGKKTQVFFRRVRPSRWLRARILILLLRDSGGGWWRCQLVENAWESQLDMPCLAGGCSHSRRAFCVLSFYSSSHSFFCPVLSLLFFLCLSLSSSLSFLSLCFFLFLRSPLVSFQFSFVRYARSVHLLYDGRTCILRGPPQKEVALKGKARLIR